MTVPSLTAWSRRRPDRTRETFARRGALYDDDYVHIRARGRDDTGRAVASPVSPLSPKEIEECEGEPFWRCASRCVVVLS